MSTGNPGEVAASVSKAREAINILQMALPGFPVASDGHKAVLKAIEQLTKVMPEAEASPDLQQNTLRQLMQQAQQNAPMMAAMRALQARGGAGMPQPGAAAPPGAGPAAAPPPPMAEAA